MKDKFNIHKDSEIWEYVDKVDVTQELVDFFEEERKKSEREGKSDKRHIAFENIDWDSINNYISNENSSLEDTAIVNILMSQVYKELEKLKESEKRRFILNKVIGLTLAEIAEIEKVSKVAILKSIRSVQSKLEKALKFNE